MVWDSALRCIDALCMNNNMYIEMKNVQQRPYRLYSDQTADLQDCRNSSNVEVWSKRLGISGTNAGTKTHLFV